METKDQKKSGKIGDNKIKEVAEKNEIVSVVSQYLTLKKSGTGYQGLCPFHNEKTPSFNVSPQKQFFHCFGCGEGGDVITFVQKIEKISFNEALHMLADKVGVKLEEGLDPKEEARMREIKKIYRMNAEAARFFYRELVARSNPELHVSDTNSENPYTYLMGRGLDSQTIKRFGLGYAPSNWDKLINYLRSKGFSDKDILNAGLASFSAKSNRIYDRFRNRIIFPIIDLKGNVIAFGGRVMDDSKPKYLNSPETPVFHKGLGLYGLNFLKEVRNIENIVIVEGYMDVIAMHKFGFVNTVASLGTAFTEQQARLLKRFSDNIIIAYDSDVAGQNATVKGLGILGREGCNIRVLKTSSGKDPDEFLRNEGAAAMDLAIKNSLPLIEYKVERCKDGLNLSVLQDRLMFMKRAVPILLSIESRVELDAYVARYAREAMVTEASVLGEIERQKNGAKSKTEVYKNVTSVQEVSEDELKIRKLKEYKQKLRNAEFRSETGLVATAIMSEEAARKVLVLTKSDEYSDPILRKIIIFVEKELLEGKMPTVVEIFNSMGEEDRYIASAILISEEPEAGIDTVERLAAVIKRNSVNKKIQELKLEMNRLYDLNKVEEANNVFNMIRDLQKTVK